MLWSNVFPDNEIQVKGLGWSEEDATVPPVGSSVLLSCLHHILLLDDGGRALHLCILLSALLRRGTLCCPLLLFVFLLILNRFSHHCHVPGAENNFCLGHLPLCFPAYPYCPMLPYPAGPLPEYANLHLGRWPWWSGEGPVWLYSGLGFYSKMHTSKHICTFLHPYTCTYIQCVLCFCVSLQFMEALISQLYGSTPHCLFGVYMHMLNEQRTVQN